MSKSSVSRSSEGDFYDYPAPQDENKKLKSLLADPDPREELRDERGTAVILNNLGLLYQRKGDHQPAVDYFQQSLEIVESIRDEMNAATTMCKLALLNDAMEKYDNAIELLEKVLKISERVGHPDSRIRKSAEKWELVKAKAASRIANFQI